MVDPSQRVVWRIGEWIADPNDDSLTRGPESIKLEPRVMHLLVCLAEAAPRVVSVDQLLEAVWGNVVVGPASVYQSVSQLRKVLGDTESPPAYIETVARKGYRLIAAVSPASSLALPTDTPVSAVDSETALPQSLPSAPTYAREESPRRSPLRSRWLTVACVAIVALAAAFVAVWIREEPARERTNDSIVVLPFADLSTDRSAQPFCDGLTEELSSWLAQLPTLDVVARTSALAFRGQNVDVRDIGRKLAVTHVLEGSVRSQGTDMRIAVKLVAADSGYEIWSETFDATSGDVLAVQERVARAVASNLEVRLTNDTLRHFDARRTASDSAHRLYLIARHHHQQLTRKDNDAAIVLYKRALAEDPKFALAYVGLAYAYLNQRYFNARAIDSIAADVEPLLALAEKLQPNLSETFVVRGALNTELRQPATARRDLERAVALDPNSLRAHSELGFLELVSGEPTSALSHYTRAAVLDPIDSTLQAQRCMAFQDLARFEEAEEACERSRVLNSRSTWPFAASAELADARGRTDEALRWNQEALARSPDSANYLRQRATWYLMLGLPREAESAYQSAVRTSGGEDPIDVPATALRLWLTLRREGRAALQAELRALDLDGLEAQDDLLEMAAIAIVAKESALAHSLAERAITARSFDLEELIDPWSARTGASHLLTIARAKQATGDTAGASVYVASLTKLLDRLTAAGVRRHGVHELRAKLLALQSRPDDAFSALQAAVDMGWTDVWRASQEGYFEALEGRPDYRALVARVEATNAQQRMRAQRVAEP
jgi:transcriptional activator of cad operon